MDKIMDLLNNISLEKYIPKLDSVLDLTQKAIELAVRIGPLCILVLGLIYLLIPPREANRHFGFRTYFGMGSIPAWQFTQRVAGLIMTLVGLILLLIAKGAVKNFAGMDLMQMSEKAFALIKTQIIWVLIIYVFMFLLTAVMFDRKGNFRLRKPENSKLDFLFSDDPVLYKILNAKSSRKEPEEEIVEEEVPVEYERQGEQVITVDDIVIEGLDE